MGTKRILILGASGMLGHVLAYRLREFGEKFDIITIARNSQYIIPDMELDLFDFSGLRKSIEQINPDICINAVGVLNKAADNIQISKKLNSELPIFLSALGNEKKFRLVHISTDCVFSGRKGNYTEIDVPDAVDNYGVTKIQGENIDANHLVIRTSIIGPEIRPHGIGLFHWFLNQEGVVKGYENVIWSGITTLALADALIQIIQKDLKGLLHLVNNMSISKRELLNLIQENFTNKKRIIVGVSKPISNKTLLNTRQDCDLGLPDYSNMISDLRSWMETYPDTYLEYLKKD